MRLAVDARHRELLRSLNLRHAAIVPLKAPGETMGALSFVLGDSGRRFAPEDLTLIRRLAARAELHLQNARLPERQTSRHAPAPGAGAGGDRAQVRPLSAEYSTVARTS